MKDSGQHVHRLAQRLIAAVWRFRPDLHHHLIGLIAPDAALDREEAATGVFLYRLIVPLLALPNIPSPLPNRRCDRPR